MQEKSLSIQEIIVEEKPPVNKHCINCALIPDAQRLFLFLNLLALLPIHPWPLTPILFLLLKYPSELGNQRGSTPYVLLSDHPQQVFRTHIAMGSRLHQVFQPLLPVSTDAISEIVDLTKLVFRIGIAVLRCHMEAADGLLHILPAFFIEVNFPGNIMLDPGKGFGYCRFAPQQGRLSSAS